jgi:hypothetical protein
MARPKTSVDRLESLRKAFKDKVGQVLTAKQVETAVGASYWRATVRDLKNSGMNIESVREGREVIGYKYMSGKSKAAGVVAPVQAAKKPTTPMTVTKVAVAEPVMASKPKSKTKPAVKKTALKRPISERIEETPAGEEDPDVLAILRQVGLQ